MTNDFSEPSRGMNFAERYGMEARQEAASANTIAKLALAASLLALAVASITAGILYHALLK